MSYNNIEDVMIKLDDIEKKIDRFMKFNNISFTKEPEVKPIYKHNIKTLSTYVNGDLRAETIYYKGKFGIQMFDNNEFVGEEFYKGKSEAYAEDAAENYVFGVKTV